MERTTVAAVLLAVAALRTTTAQMPTTAPPTTDPATYAPTTYPPMTDQPTYAPTNAPSTYAPTSGPPSGSQMDSGSDGSSSGGTNGPYTWMPMPTVNTGGSGFNWTWGDASLDSSSSSSSSAGSVHYNDGEDAIEVHLPGLDADIAALTRRKYTFNTTQGFAVNATRGGVAPGNCTHHAYCMHFVFESDYGAMSPFDAFVLDRFESAGGPVGGFSHGSGSSGGPHGWESGPVPLVLGRMSNATFDKLGGNWSDVLNWNESRRTTWTLYPSPHARASNEIDLTLSLKQLYTLLPGYKESVNNRSQNANNNNGPFYSADLSDQVIIRVQAQIPSPFTSASAMLPLVVNHTGSQLVDISLSSSLLYTGNGAQGGNEMQLTFKLTRRKYGGALPWTPAEPSYECAQCAALQHSTDTFDRCLNRKLEGMQLVMQDLLTFTNDRTQFDLEPFAEACFAEMLGNSTNTSTTAPTPAPTSPSYFNGTDWVEYGAMPSFPSTMEDDGWTTLRDTDAALRCWAQTQCNLAGTSVKSDAQIVVLHHEPARTRVDFGDAGASFYLQLGLEDATQDEIITTQVFYYSHPPEYLAREIARAFPNADQLQLDIEVRKSNNSREVHEIRSYNQRLLDAYHSAMQWSTGSDGSAGSAGSTGSHLGREDAGFESPGSAGSSWGPTAGGSGSGGSDAGTWGPTAQPTVQPQRPALLYEPAELFTIEIISHNITVVPHVVAVFSSNYIANRESTDNALRFQVAPLNVSKFQYVAPPAAVDLSWASEPAWKTQARRLLPTFASNDSCVHCAGHLEACLLDEDCVYGVNSYFADAMAWHRLANRIYVGDSPSFGGPELKSIRVDASDTLLQAKWFFPNKGFAKLEQLLSCWSMMSCSLDEPRNELPNPNMSDWRLAPPTKIQFTGAEMDVMTTELANITVFNGMRHIGYTMTGDALAFQNFLTDVVFQDATNARDLVVFHTNPDNTMRPGEIQFTVRWRSAFYVPMSVGGSQAMMRHGKLEISTIRLAAHVANGWQDLWWARLSQWLGLFRFVPFNSTMGTGNTNTNNSTGGWNWNSTNTNNNNSTTNTTTPTNLPPPTNVCPVCADALLSCVQDAGCASAARTWMAAVLPGGTMASYYIWDGLYYAQWNSPALNADASTSTLAIPDEYRDRLLSLTACLARYQCAVGYNLASNTTNATNTTSGSAFVPTTITLQATLTMFTPPTTGFALSYKQNQLSWPTMDENSDLASVFTAIESTFGDKISINRVFDSSAGMYFYMFQGPRHALMQLSLTGIAAPGNISAIKYDVSFHSPAPTLPVWDGFASWLNKTASSGASNATQMPSLDAVCAACLPKVQACFNDQECWRSVQDMVVPALKQQTAQLPSTATWTTTGAYVYGVDLGTVLLQQIVEMPTRAFFTTPASWQAFTDVLQCVAVAQCDVETMDSATTPPATAHVPSYLRLEPAQIKMELHMDTRVETMVNGELLAFSEYGTDSTMEIEAFVRNAVGGSSDVPLTITRTISDQATNVLTYVATFGDSYFGRVPQMYIASNGHVVEGTALPFVVVTPWRVTFESFNQFPEWDKLLNLLAVAPTSTGGTTGGTTGTPPAPSYLANCLSGDAVKRECYNDYECKYLLTTVALPLLQSTLEATPANFNSNLNVFEVDLTAALVSQVMWLASVSDVTKANVMKLLYETTVCAGSEPAATSQTRPTFQNPRVQFTRPARGPLQLEYLGETFSVNDQDTAIDGRTAFQNFVYDNVIARTIGQPGALIHNWWTEGEQVKYDVEFVRLFKTPLPRLFWVDETTQQRSDSSDSAWRMSFQSSSYTIYSDAQGWLAWLTTSPV